jgi:hypothetical protein
MVPSLRRWLRLHPRLVLAVLLAFGVELVPPSAVVRHRHDGGGITHSHAGRIVGSGATLAAEAGTSDDLRVASATDLHAHETQPFVAMAGPDASLGGPVLQVTAASGSIASGEIPAASRPTQARAPPATVA